MSLSVDEGDVVICEATFTTAATGALIDPTDVYFQTKTSGGTIVTYHYGVDPEVQRISTGYYRASVGAASDGDWFVRWYSTGTGKAAKEIKFNVKASEFV